MYSEDIYSSHSADHSIIIIYCTVFAVLSIALLFKMVFYSESREFANSLD